MNKTETFEQFLTAGASDISVMGLVLNLILAAILSMFLSRVYVKYGTSLSNRKAFAKNFILSE